MSSVSVSRVHFRSVREIEPLCRSMRGPAVTAALFVRWRRGARAAGGGPAAAGEGCAWDGGGGRGLLRGRRHDMTNVGHIRL